MVSQPRVAIVGGGIAGSLCALTLKSRGAAPKIFDLGKHSVGGRMGQRRNKGRPGDTGAQFFRVADDSSQFAQAVRILVEHNLVAPWNGRFGMLGSRGGGFLPAEIISSTAVTRMKKGEEGPIHAKDSDDFCGFIGSSSSGPKLVGTPSMHHVCEGLCSLAGIEVRRNTRVTDLEIERNDGSWNIIAEDAHSKSSSESSCESGFHAVVVAVHNPSFGAKFVERIAALETDTDQEHVAQRLRSLASDLHDLRNNHSAPLVTFSAYYPAGFSARVPFDAASCPTSNHLQLLVREASKPGREPLAGNEELWTAISTSSFAESLLRRSVSMPDAAEELSQEFTQLLTPTLDGGATATSPLRVFAKSWRAGFATKSLALKEDCVSFAPWRFAICGDFIRSHPNPIEAAALSGMEAAERVASWFTTPADHS